MTVADDSKGIAGYAYGDYVMFDPGYCEPEIGRITGPSASGNWLVCYYDGCTAASTPGTMLRPATEEEIAQASERIGHHRFDEECPEYDPDTCFCCIHNDRLQL